MPDAFYTDFRAVAVVQDFYVESSSALSGSQLAQALKTQRHRNIWS